MLLQHLLEQGLGKRAIAKQFGVSRRTVHHGIATGQLTRVVKTEGIRMTAPRPQKLDRFTPLIHERLAAYPALSAERLFAECRAAGYVGGATRLRDYVASVRPRPEPEPIIRFETAPGLQAQFDFADVKLPWVKRYAVLVYLEFVPRQTALAVMQSLERASADFGGSASAGPFVHQQFVEQRQHLFRLLGNPTITAERRRTVLEWLSRPLPSLEG